MSILTKIKKRNFIKSAAITETASLAPESKWGTDSIEDYLSYLNLRRENILEEMLNLFYPGHFRDKQNKQFCMAARQERGRLTT